MSSGTAMRRRAANGVQQPVATREARGYITGAEFIGNKELPMKIKSTVRAGATFRGAR